VRERLGRVHPALAIAGMGVAGYLALTAVVAVSGLLVTHVLAHGSLGGFDHRINAYFAAHRHPPWNGLSLMLTDLAGFFGVIPIAVVVTGVLLLRGRGRRALPLVIGLVIEFSVSMSASYLVGRPRPDVTHLGPTPPTYSWPSGHTAATCVLFGGIALLVMSATRRIVPRIAAWVVAVGATSAVGLSRVYEGQHHPSDVVAGALVGVGALWFAWGALRAADAAKASRQRDEGRLHRVTASQYGSGPRRREDVAGRIAG
jgi:membrane-associated phospholipid phosphatase